LASARVTFPARFRASITPLEHPEHGHKETAYPVHKIHRQSRQDDIGHVAVNPLQEVPPQAKSRLRFLSNRSFLKDGKAGSSNSEARRGYWPGITFDYSAIPVSSSISVKKHTGFFT
jgi:hypothetical protein